MATEQLEKNKQGAAGNEDAIVKPDAATLHTTDPQEEMEGPISSLMHKAGESLENEEPGEAGKEVEK